MTLETLTWWSEGRKWEGENEKWETGSEKESLTQIKFNYLTHE